MSKNNIKKESYLLDPIDEKPMYGIYQLKTDPGMHYHRFTPLIALLNEGNAVERSNYDFVYSAQLTDADTLDTIYERFNIDHPADFKGHSLSVSDIIVLKENGKLTAHYVDTIGFEEVPEFLAPANTLEQEPVVTVTSSEWPKFSDGETMPLSKVNTLFYLLDKQQHADRIRPEHSGPWYYKTHFQIHYTQNGERHSYIGRVDFGDGHGSLIEHIRSVANYHLNCPDWQNYMAAQGKAELDENNALWKEILYGFIPYMILHCELAKIDEYADNVLSAMQGMDSYSSGDVDKALYYRSVKKYAAAFRTALNSGGMAEFPEFPKPCDALPETERKTLESYEQRIGGLPRPVWRDNVPSPQKGDTEM